MLLIALWLSGVKKVNILIQFKIIIKSCRKAGIRRLLLKVRYLLQKVNMSGKEVIIKMSDWVSGKFKAAITYNSSAISKFKILDHHLIQGDNAAIIIKNHQENWLLNNKKEILTSIWNYKIKKIMPRLQIHLQSNKWTN